MADAKLSELTAATTAAAADSVYLVQGTTSKKITTANLLGSIATPVGIENLLQIKNEDTITAPGPISITTNITHLEASISGACTISSGAQGQVKIILMTENSGAYTWTLSGSNVAGTISFAAINTSATLIYSNDKWYMSGGTAALSL